MIKPFSDKLVVHSQPFVLFGTVMVLGNTFLFRVTDDEFNSIIGLINLN